MDLKKIRHVLDGMDQKEVSTIKYGVGRRRGAADWEAPCQGQLGVRLRY